MRERNSKYNTKVERRGTASGEEYLCVFNVIKEYSFKRPLKMVIFERQLRRSRQATERMVTVDKGLFTVDGTVLDDGDAREYAAAHKTDIERLLVESSKRYGSKDEETDLVRDLNIARLADKAGQSGSYAVIRFHDHKAVRELKIGRNSDGPVFILDGNNITRQEAVRYIDDNYMSFLCGLQQAEAGIGGYRVETKKEENPVKPDGKPVFDLDKLLPSQPKKAAKNKEELREIGSKLFSTRAKSHLN